LFELAKKAAIASAIVNTASGATKALQQGGFWGIAMAAAVVASGAAQIARIRATTFDGAGEGSLTRPGTVVNPLITSPSSSLPSDRMRSGGVAEIHFHGDMYGWDTYIEKKVIGSVRRALDENDMVIFSRDSRQALELAGG
jgi:hypothetical protein